MMHALLYARTMGPIYTIPYDEYKGTYFGVYTSNPHLHGEEHQIHFGCIKRIELLCKAIKYLGPENQELIEDELLFVVVESETVLWGQGIEGNAWLSKVPVNIGDWIVVNSNNTLEVVDDTTFRAKYRKVMNYLPYDYKSITAKRKAKEEV